MGFGFDRPIGPGADVSELEYISALVQTDPRNLRTDGSLQAQDIALFLNSRHGVDISTNQAEEWLMRDFGTDGYLDLMQLVALLIIPCLKRDTDFAKRMLPMILHDVFGRSNVHSVPLTPANLKRILTSLGEPSLAKDDELISQMIATAAAHDTAESIILNAESFAFALTNDLDAFQIENATTWRTNLNDVLSDTDGQNTSDHKKQATGDAESPLASNNKLKCNRTAAHLDMAADTYRSRPLVTAIWVSFVISFFTYYSGVGTFVLLPECNAFQFRSSFADNAGAFFCTIGWSLGRWLYIVLIMSIYGIAYFTLTGIGNGIDNTNPFYPFAGACFAAVFTFVPPMLQVFEHDNDVIDVFLESISLLSGGVVVVLNIWATFTISWALFSKKIRKSFVPETIRTETLIKQAAVKKLNSMVTNAMDMHQIKSENSAIQSHLGKSLWNYAQHANTQVERIGGFQWTWQRIWTRDIYHSEGLWYPSRLISINVTQLFVTIFILLVGLLITVIVTAEYQPPESVFEQLLDQLFDLTPNIERIQEIVQSVSGVVSTFVAEDLPTDGFACTNFDDPVDCSTFPSIDECVAARDNDWLCTLVDYTLENGDAANPLTQQEFLRGAGFDVAQVYDSSVASLAATSLETVDSLYPTEKYMIFVPLVIFTLVAFATALSITLTTIPSMTSTALKLRAGVIDLMHDPKQKAMRIAPDQVAFLQGAMFWNLLVSSFLMGGLVGLAVFLIVYQNTSALALRLIASLIGVIAVLLLHNMSVRLCRRISSKSMYRKRPMLANVVLLCRECAFFALTIAFTAVRTAKLLFSTLLFVGRVDIPFLANGVSEIEAFGYKLDNHPYFFRMLIIQSEAHRHPYIETLGVLCLRKLRHGSNFITRAGSTWRLVLVLMFMPWLTKYRKLSRPETTDSADGGMPPILEESTTSEVEQLQRQVQILKERLSISLTSAAADPLRRRGSDGLQPIQPMLAGAQVF